MMILELGEQAGCLQMSQTLDELAGPQRAHLLNYLKASSHARGLLINFGSERLQYERLVFTARTP
ncbi:MAG: GxxExxY protein [Pirellulales bacterium]